MSKTNFVIYSSDKDYATCWGRYLKDRSNLPFEIRIFTEEKELFHFAAQEKINILLWDGEEKSEKQPEAEISFWLYENRKREYMASEHFINKYQSASEILSIIINCCITEKRLYSNEYMALSTKIIGVYSPIGRSLKTLISIGLAEAFSREEPTLFLSFDEYSCMSAIFTNLQFGSISDLLYYFKQEKSNIAMRMMGLVNRWNKMDYFLPPSCREDIKDMSLEEFREFLTLIREKSDYKYIVIDFGNMFGAIADIMECCDSIITPVLKDGLSLAKHEDFKKMLEERNFDNNKKELNEINSEELKKMLTGTDIEHLVNSPFGETLRSWVDSYKENGKWNLKL